MRHSSQESKRPQPPRGWVMRLWRYLVFFKLTRGGRFLLVSGIVSGMLSAEWWMASTWAMFFMLFYVGLFALVVNMLFRPKLRVECHMPQRAMAGSAVSGVVRVQNAAARRRAFHVAAAFSWLPRAIKNISPEVTLHTLEAGAQGQLPVSLLPRKRGFYCLGELRAFTIFPLNFFRSGSARTSLPPLVVLPRFTPLEGLDVPLGRLYQPGGFALTSNIGDSPEYIGNRDYVPGDSVRRIDSRAWARLGHPAVREYQEEYYCRIALVLDTFIPRTRRQRPEGFAELEAAVSLSAAIADALTRGEYIIDLFAAGPELYTFRAGLNIAHLENVLEILACVEPCRTDPFEKIAPALAEEVANLAVVICVFVDWDASRQHLVRTIEEAGCRTKTIIVRDAAPTAPLQGAELGDVALFSAEEILQGKVSRL